MIRRNPADAAGAGVGFVVGLARCTPPRGSLPPAWIRCCNHPAARPGRRSCPVLDNLRPLLQVQPRGPAPLSDRPAHSLRDDPSNADPRFDRVRIRALLPALAAEGLTCSVWPRPPPAWARAQVALGRARAGCGAGPFAAGTERHHHAGRGWLCRGRGRNAIADRRCRTSACRKRPLPPRARPRLRAPSTAWLAVARTTLLAAADPRWPAPDHRAGTGGSAGPPVPVAQVWDGALARLWPEPEGHDPAGPRPKMGWAGGGPAGHRRADCLALPSVWQDGRLMACRPLGFGPDHALECRDPQAGSWPASYRLKHPANLPIYVPTPSQPVKEFLALGNMRNIAFWVVLLLLVLALFNLFWAGSRPWRRIAPQLLRFTSPPCRADRWPRSRWMVKRCALTGADGRAYTTILPQDAQVTDLLIPTTFPSRRAARNSRPSPRSCCPCCPSFC